MASESNSNQVVQAQAVCLTWEATQLKSIHPCTKCGMGGNLGTACLCDRPGRTFTSPDRYSALPAATQKVSGILGGGVCKRKPAKTNSANGSMPVRGRPPKKVHPATPATPATHKAHRKPHRKAHHKLNCTSNRKEQEAFEALFAEIFSAKMTAYDTRIICENGKQLRKHLNDGLEAEIDKLCAEVMSW